MNAMISTRIYSLSQQKYKCHSFNPPSPTLPSFITSPSHTCSPSLLSFAPYCSPPPPPPPGLPSLPSSSFFSPPSSGSTSLYLFIFLLLLLLCAVSIASRGGHTTMSRVLVEFFCQRWWSHDHAACPKCVRLAIGGRSHDHATCPNCPSCRRWEVTRPCCLPKLSVLS